MRRKAVQAGNFGNTPEKKNNGLNLHKAGYMLIGHSGVPRHQVDLSTLSLSKIRT